MQNKLLRDPMMKEDSENEYIGSHTKICTKCRLMKNLAEFHKHKAMKGGHTSKCKTCISEYDKVRRQKPETVEKEAKRAKQRTANGEWKERYWEKKKSGGNRT